MRPHLSPTVLLRLLLAACGLLVPMLPPASMAQSPPFQGPLALCREGDPAFVGKAEALIAAKVDAERARLAPYWPALRPDPELIRIAQRRSCDMALGAAFSHNDAEGHFIAGDMMRQIFGPFGAVGENIMRMGATIETSGVRPFGPEEFARAAVDAWMKSPEHRANILNPGFDIAGVGVAKVGDAAFVTQVFHGPAPRGPN